MNNLQIQPSKFVLTSKNVIGILSLWAAAMKIETEAIAARGTFGTREVIEIAALSAATAFSIWGRQVAKRPIDYDVVKWVKLGFNYLGNNKR